MWVCDTADREGHEEAFVQEARLYSVICDVPPVLSTKGRETQYIARLLVQELGEAPLVVVVCAHVVKNGLLGLQRWEIAPPTERLYLGQPVVGLVELDGAPLDLYGEPVSWLSLDEIDALVYGG